MGWGWGVEGWEVCLLCLVSLICIKTSQPNNVSIWSLLLVTRNSGYSGGQNIRSCEISKDRFGFSHSPFQFVSLPPCCIPHYCLHKKSLSLTPATTFICHHWPSLDLWRYLYRGTLFNQLSISLSFNFVLVSLCPLCVYMVSWVWSVLFLFLYLEPDDYFYFYLKNIISNIGKLFCLHLPNISVDWVKTRIRYRIRVISYNDVYMRLSYKK